MSFRLLIPFISNRVRRHRVALTLSPVALSILTAAGCGQLAQKERELVFGVVPGTASWYSSMPGGIVETNLPLRRQHGSEHIHTWWWPAENKDAPAILYLHGARWNLTGQLFRIEQWHELGFSVLAIDYRGFGKSGGDYPSEEAVYEDARTAWEHLARLQPDSSKRFIYGHSLGGAVAVDLAASLKGDAAGGLIVESSFSSLADIARSFTSPWLPVQLILSQKFDSLRKIKKVSMPVLVVHGTADHYVPSQLSEKLYAAVRGSKKLLLVAGGTHNNCMWSGRIEYRDALRSLFGLGTI
ncbi:MAG: putative exported protein [Paucimonas sp.]|nr:putative exported protein [Paucimonas sp.]